MAEYIVNFEEYEEKRIDCWIDKIGRCPIEYPDGEVIQRIVRCRDCKHFAEGKKSCWCENYRHDNSCFYPEVNYDGFCAWGEPKEVE